VHSDRILPTFLGKELLPSLDLNIKPKQQEATGKHSLPLAGCLLDLFFDPEGGDDTILRNVSEFDLTTQHRVPENCTLYSHRSENLNSGE
jgi:hypothetical protein